MTINIEPTVKAVDHVANTLRSFADEIDRINERIIEEKDLSRTAEVLIAITNCFSAFDSFILLGTFFTEISVLNFFITFQSQANSFFHNLAGTISPDLHHPGFSILLIVFISIRVIIVWFYICWQFFSFWNDKNANTTHEI